MPYEVVMPQLGLTMTEGAVTNWLKKPGDHVDRGEPLFTVETDKVEMEVESTRDGYVNSIELEPGKVVPVGTVIASLVDEASEVGTRLEFAANPTMLDPKAHEHAAEAAATGSLGAAAPAVKRQIPESGSAGRRGDHPISPRAKQLAKSLSLDISLIIPSGSRIVEEDIWRYISESAGEGISAPMGGSSNRAAIAKRTTVSFQTAPHFYLSTVANVNELVKLREDLVTTSQARVGIRLTYTDLFLKALAIALRENPDVNSQWHGNKIVSRPSVDVGFAVQGTDSLLVPVLRNADQLSLFDLAVCRKDLTDKARNGYLTLVDVEGGSATLSNLGAFGVDWFEAILNSPQSVILATGQIAKRPVVVGDRLEVASTLVLTLSVDHRVLDGAAGAKFLQRVKELIEGPHVLE